MNEAIELLQSVKEKQWSTWLAHDAALVEKRDLRGIEHLLSAFGGMGSLIQFGRRIRLFSPCCLPVKLNVQVIAPAINQGASAP